MDTKLQEINRHFVRLGKEAEKKNNKLLRQVLQDFEMELKKDQLFKTLYMKMFFGGSYYDKLKVKDPNEYDIDVLLVLPKLCKTTLRSSQSAGYVEAVVNLDDIIKKPSGSPTSNISPGLHANRSGAVNKHRRPKTHYRKVTRLIEGNKMSISKVNRWFEGIVQQAVNNLKLSDRLYEIEGMSKNGPAITLHITQESNWFDVDLVPCFNFRKSSWPPGYRQSTSQEDFFIVPKPAPNKSDHLWRLSFQLQERKLLINKWNVKPALRLLKANLVPLGKIYRMKPSPRRYEVLRDNEVCMVPIKSYFLKTIFLWEVQKEEAFRNESLIRTFLHMLRKFYEYIKDKKIPYYWNENLNLLTCSEESLYNIETRLQNIINNIKQGKTETLEKYFGKD